ncbi:GSCOCG00011714001-RA-CDS [Cotesia congregata]|nr:GSCOCG00011714001-RA-CDS [Cotesia congregata]
MGKSIESRMHKNANDILRLVVFPVLQDDEIVRLIRYDWLIILYGNKLCIKYTPHYQHNMIRARLRLIGRFLSAAKEINSELTDLASLFYPKYIETDIKAIGQVARINYLKNVCEAPAVALNLVTYIRQIAVILETEYVVQENEVLQKQVSNFLKVYNSEMSIAVNKIASESQAKMRRHKIIILPITKDIQKLIIHIKITKKNCFDILKERFDYHTWLAASKLVAAYLLVFNRRRVGDVQNMVISDMDRLQSIDEQADKEEYNALDDDGKKIAANYYRIEIRGKLNKDVAVIVSNDIVDEIKLLIRYRESANVPTDNDFVFGLPNGVNNRIRVLNLCAVLRELSVSCGAEKPELLRGTHLRKHVATKCVEFELSDNVLSDLTKHMGHSEKIHKDFYQRPIKSKTIVQVTKLLHAVHGPVTDEEIEKEDIFTNDQNEFIEFEDSINMAENKNNLDALNETDPDFDSNLPSNSVEIPNETEILFDHNLPCTSSAHNSVVITDYAQMLNQSTPKDRQSTITVSETCKSTKKPWSDEEKKVIFTEFKEYIISRTHPPLKDIDDVKAKYPCLNGRSRDTVKAWINNHYKKKPSNVLNKKKGIKIISVKNKNYNLKRLTKKSLDL